MRTLFALGLFMVFGLAAGFGFAQEVTDTAPVIPAIDGTAVEDWFFNFLGKLLDLFADFIGKILQQIFGGVAGMFTGGPAA